MGTRRTSRSPSASEARTSSEARRASTSTRRRGSGRSRTPAPAAASTRVDVRPVWQKGPGVDNQYSNGKRQFPDVSAPADPYTGWYIVVGGEGSTAGGTSASSPFWAGLAALYEQMAKEAGLTGLGFLSPTLYAVAASSPADTVFHDIVRGGNLFHETTPGWDYATGLGTPIATGLGDAIVAYLLEQQLHDVTGQLRVARHSECSAPMVRSTSPTNAIHSSRVSSSRARDRNRVRCRAVCAYERDSVR